VEPLPPAIESADITGLLSFSPESMRLGLAALVFVGLLAAVAVRARQPTEGKSL
jgi:hypothetical protein